MLTDTNPKKRLDNRLLDTMPVKLLETKVSGVGAETHIARGNKVYDARDNSHLSSSTPLALKKHELESAKNQSK